MVEVGAAVEVPMVEEGTCSGVTGSLANSSKLLHLFKPAVDPAASVVATHKRLVTPTHNTQTLVTSTHNTCHINTPQHLSGPEGNG